MRRVSSVVGVFVLAVAPLLIAVYPAAAWQCPDSSPNDFLTGGGFIIPFGAHANFAIGGACKKGGDGHGLWGHLEYIDHSSGLNVHWLTITAYVSDVFLGDPNARVICGTVRTNGAGGVPTSVDFVVRAADHGEPGSAQAGGSDQFDIALESGGTIVYATAPPGSGVPPHTLQGGNIQLHKPIKQLTTFAESCPAAVPYGISI